MPPTPSDTRREEASRQAPRNPATSACRHTPDGSCSGTSNGEPCEARSSTRFSGEPTHGSAGDVSSQAVRERERLWRHDRRADVELDQRVRVERDRARHARVALAVDVGGHLSLGQSDLRAAERLLPEVEVVAQRVDPMNRDSLWMIPSRV